MLRARRRRRRPEKNDKKIYRVNERIRAQEVILIDEKGEHLGKMATAHALKIANDKELDLVEVSPKADPPVCRILNYGQFLYQQSRKLQTQKAHYKKLETKVVRISFKIGKHDLELKQNQAKKFLQKGHKVMVEMILKGREKQYKYKALEILNKFVQTLNENLVIEQPPKYQGGRISALITLSKIS